MLLKIQDNLAINLWYVLSSYGMKPSAFTLNPVEVSDCLVVLIV